MASAGSRRRKTTAIAGAAATLAAVAVAAVLIASPGGTGAAGARPRSVGRWTSLTSLTTIRGTPDAITLYAGQVLVAGGGVGALPTAASELYDPGTGRWSATGRLLQARRGARAVLLRNGRVLIAGGIAGGRILASAEIFDPVSRRWSRTGSMHVPRLAYTLTLLPDGKVLAAGGASTTGVAGSAGGQAVRITSSAELYNPATGTWAPTGSMAAGRFEASGTSLPDGAVLIAGGFGGPPAGGQFQPLASTEIYGSTPGAFAPAASMSEARADQDAVALAGGAVLVTGGLGGDGSSALASAERYSPTTRTWSEASAMRQARDAAAAAALPDGYVLVAGGQAVDGGAQEPLASAELYAPASNRWLLAGTMACPRSEPAIAALAGGSALVLAGDATFPGQAPVAQGCVDRYAPPTAPRRAGNQ
ncbi:MAG TPA: kelch repeat-containing protein [Solirubrobacteraceae bacterium]|nr:kelch repeat-containing protein [Solirubrobacteraceae bacterium]